MKRHIVINDGYDADVALWAGEKGISLTQMTNLALSILDGLGSFSFSRITHKDGQHSMVLQLLSSMEPRKPSIVLVYGVNSCGYHLQELLLFTEFCARYTVAYDGTWVALKDIDNG